VPPYACSSAQLATAHWLRWQKNILQFWVGNNLDSGAFKGAQRQWDQMEVPFYSVGNWTGFGPHKGLCGRYRGT
jgi:hypothetical protein